MAAEQCVGLAEGKQVIVLPTKTVPQGVSALLSADPEGEAEDNTAAMTEAIARVHTSEITYAARDSDLDRKSTRLNSSHITRSRMPSSA